MKILLIRHGKSIDDEDGVSQRDNSPLSDAGADATYARAKDFSGLTLEVCYVSDYQRAKDTATILFPGIPQVIRNDIFEIQRPAFLTGGDHADAVHFWEVLHKQDKYKPDWSLDDSESFNDVTRRARKFLDYLMENHESSVEPIVVVTHGGFMRHLIGVACLGDRYSPDIFFGLLLPLQVDNLEGFLLDIQNDGRASWSYLS